MTEEQATKLVELVQEYTTGLDRSTTIIGIIIGIALLYFTGIIVWEIYRFKKIKAWKDEYYASLNDEQKKAVSQWRELNK